MFMKHKKVFLHNSDINQLKCSYSRGYQRRTIALAGLVNNCRELLAVQVTDISLVVLSRKDWQKLFSYKYGIVRLKITKNKSTIIVPAEYSAQLLHSFDEQIAAANKAALVATGQLHEFLDILVLFEFIRAVLSTKYKDVLLEQNSASKFWQCLDGLELDDLAQRCNEWSKIFMHAFDAKILTTSRSKLSIQKKLSLYSYYLLKAKETA